MADREAERRRAAELDQRLSECVALNKLLRGDAERIERLRAFVDGLAADKA